MKKIILILLLICIVMMGMYGQVVKYTLDSTRWGGKAFVGEGLLAIGYTGTNGYGELCDASTGAVLHRVNGTASTTSNAEFGYPVVGAGTYVAFSAPYNNKLAGAVYVYDATTGSLLYGLDNPTNVASVFGYSIGASATADLLVVAQEEQKYKDVFLYRLSSGASVATLTSPTAVTQVAMSGNVLVVGHVGYATSYDATTLAVQCNFTSSIVGFGLGVHAWDDVIGVYGLDTYGTGAVTLFNRATCAQIASINGSSFGGTQLGAEAMMMPGALFLANFSPSVTMVFDPTTGAFLFNLTDPTITLGGDMATDGKALLVVAGYKPPSVQSVVVFDFSCPLGFYFNPRTQVCATCIGDVVGLTCVPCTGNTKYDAATGKCVVPITTTTNSAAVSSSSNLNSFIF